LTETIDQLQAQVVAAKEEAREERQIAKDDVAEERRVAHDLICAYSSDNKEVLATPLASPPPPARSPPPAQHLAPPPAPHPTPQSSTRPNPHHPAP
jgi:hypothetical protein